MRFTAIVPSLCLIASLVLAFLCLFAGRNKDFMTGYDILTFNTSRLAYNLLGDDGLLSEGGLLADAIPPQFTDILNNLPENITNEINNRIGATAAALGVDDFYSIHILDYCFGDYTPGPLPNATLSADSISKNVSDCSDVSVPFHFSPGEIIEQKLNESNLPITLQDLNWPDDIQRGIDALHVLQTAVFVLYCISIGLIFIALIPSLIAVFTSGRMSACCCVIFSALAFLAVGIASALVTAVIVEGVKVINRHGEQIGLSADRGNKFMAITWASTALTLVALIWWLLETCIGHRKKTPYAKHG